MWWSHNYGTEADSQQSHHSWLWKGKLTLDQERLSNREPRLEHSPTDNKSEHSLENYPRVSGGSGTSMARRSHKRKQLLNCSKGN